MANRRQRVGRGHEALGIDVPEADCPLLLTLDGAVRYLTPRLATT